jgi:Lhr-like helicase
VHAAATPPTAERSAQNQRLPTVLVTTPESLSLLLVARRCGKAVLGSGAHGGRGRVA